MQKRLDVYSNRGQGVVLVLYSLRELCGACEKQEVLKFIQNADLYDISRYDLPPYPGQNEPKYHTLLAWARKDALIEGWLVDTRERDAWQLSRTGGQVLDKAIQKFRSSEWTVRKCYLWTPKFKKLVDPSYETSPEDASRPGLSVSLERLLRA
jgi:hypothetical protein